MLRNPDHFVSAVISRLVVGDPLASALVSAAARDYPDSFDAAAAFVIAVDSSDVGIDRARSLATTRRERQHLVIVECWLVGDRDRVGLLAREHLSSFPDDLVISWLVGGQ